MKLGAVNYLCKPASTDELIAAFEGQTANPDIVIPDNPPSIERVEWEHIQRVLQENENNISATARALGMHRRTLQRKLRKRPVRQ
jgi:two-component system response regulator RegA